MADRAFNIAAVFRGDTSQLKAATQDARRELSSVGQEAAKGVPAVNALATALNKDAEAARGAARAFEVMSAAEKRNREQVLRAAGIVTPVQAQPQAGVSGLNSTASTVAFGASTRDQTTLLRGLGAEVEATRQETALYRAELDAVRARYNPLFAASQRYEQELRDIAAAEKLGAISAIEAARARDVAAASMAPLGRQATQAAAGMKQLGGGMKLQAHEARNLSYQINDVFQSLLLGMPIQQVVLQQGPQIAQIYGGVGNTFRALARALTPARLLLGSTAAGALVAASSWNSYLTSIKEVETASKGLGRATAGSAAGMEASARSGAAAAGISIRAARSMQAEFLRSGEIGSANFGDLIGLSKDFAATIGIDAKDAGAALTDMFADPAKGAEQLYEKYGLINASTARSVTNLAAQNRVVDAQGVLASALTKRLIDAGEATTALGRAWDGVKEKASNAGNAIGGAINGLFEGPSLQDEINKLEAYLGRNENLPANRQNTAGLEDARRELADLRRTILAEERRAYEQRARNAAERQGRMALGIAENSPATKRAREEQDLRNEIAALQTGQNAPGLDTQQSSEINDTIEAKTRALDALINRQQRAADLDMLEIRIANERNPLLRAELEARRTRLRLSEDEISTTELQTSTARARQRIIDETIASAAAQAQGMSTEVQARQRLTLQVAAGIIPASEVNRLLEEELALRPLVAAAAVAEGAEKARLQDVIEGLRDAYEERAKAERAARAAESGQTFIRSQSERISMLRIEFATLGATEVLRKRILALAEAEQEIRSMKIDPDSALAGQIRRNAAALAEQTRELERQVDAWGKVQSASESAIDGSVDALAKGDFGGALESISSEFNAAMLDLAVKNPLKNALLGTDYGTMSDVGGLGGIFDRLTGKGTPNTLKSGLFGQSVQDMSITATNVTIANGSMSFASGMLGTAGGAGNINGAPGAVPSKVWDFFTGKGLAPHQVAGIMGNVSAESAFDPNAVGDGGTSFGLFQHHAGRGKGLLGAVGGVGGLGDIQAQLEYTWQELLTGENGVLKKLMASTNVASATSAFAGFERPAGWTAANPQGSSNWLGRLAGAESALAKFGDTAVTSTQDLGVLGKGFDLFGSALGSGLQGLASGGAGGGLAGFLGTLGSSFASSLGIPGFATGGRHKGGLRIVGEDGPELEYTGPSTILPAELTQQLRTSRAPGMSAPAATSASAPIIHMPVSIQNFGSDTIETEQTTDSKGQPQLTMIVGRQMAAAQAQRGNPARKGLQSEFGLRPVARDRG
tara:strand:- start:2043 stop:5867 length:3825 start_codon:yes stop_codon:yes gene_type:complete